MPSWRFEPWARRGDFQGKRDYGCSESVVSEPRDRTSSEHERFESCPLRSTDVVDITTLHLVKTEFKSGNESPPFHSNRLRLNCESWA